MPPQDQWHDVFLHFTAGGAKKMTEEIIKNLG
jgi:hypothetical protein